MADVVTTDCVPCNALRILITDDEPSVRDVFRMILSFSFPMCTIDVASNGQETVESFQQFHHGILLLDLKMPVMDGQTAFDKISELCAERKWAMPAIIFCTGYAPTPSVRMRVETDPRHGLIQKPVTSDIIRAAVKARLPV